MVAEEQRRSGGGGWWRGGGPAGGRRLPASRCGPAHWGWVGAWASVGRSWNISGAPANFRCKGVASAAFCSVLLEIVFARVRVSMCARTNSKVKVVYHSRCPGHVVDGRARSGERSSELWVGVENKDLG